MSTTIIQRFYEMAKQEAEAPALGVYDNGTYHNLPWWFVKSKAKHFGLGLLEEKAERGDYFYLFSSKNPTWIYSELGGLTIGLKTVPLPANLNATRLEELMKQFPPAFIFMGERVFSEELNFLKNIKNLKKIILNHEDPSFEKVTGLPAASFRQIFNNGIRFESKYHTTYREVRQSFTELDEMSPVFVDENGTVTEISLRFGEVDRMIAHLSRQCSQNKIHRIFSSVDLSHTLGRVTSLYWPIFLGIQTVLDHPHLELLTQLQKTRPEAVYFSQERMVQLDRELLPYKKELFPTTTTFPQKLISLVKTKLLTYRLKRKLGGKIKYFFQETAHDGEFQKILSALKIQTFVPQEDLLRNR